MSSTTSQLASQWANPTDVTTVLMIIGGDVVQKALAQTAGCWYTPVCFSFGWVAYSFMALVSVIGDGRLLPAPDYPVKVFNMRTGYVRDNKNWVIGRLLRDHEAYISRQEPASGSGIRIAVWEAKDNVHRSKVSFSYSRIHLWGIITTVVQLAIAALPLIQDRRWGILLITGSGTLMALITGSLPQWRAEKLPNRQQSDKVFALTTGNGSKDIMIIIGGEKCLDLEDLAAQETPRSGRPWEKFKLDTTKPSNQDTWVHAGAHRGFLLGCTRFFLLCRMKYRELLLGSFYGIPGGFFITVVVCVAQSILWLLYLVTVAALSTDTWYLIVIGGIGMFQNGYVAAMERTPEHRNCPLQLRDVMKTSKVMDGLMDVQTVYKNELTLSKNVAEPFMMPLVKEYFPGRLSKDEEDWWKDKTDKYDDEREKDKEFRGFPQSALSRRTTGHSIPEPKDPGTGSEKVGKHQHASNYNASSERNQSLGSDPGRGFEPERKTTHDSTVRPKSASQIHHSTLDSVSEQHTGDMSTGTERIATADQARLLPNRQGSSARQNQRHSMPPLGRIVEHNERGSIAKPPAWS